MKVCICFLSYICDIFRLFPLLLSLAFKKYLSTNIIHSNEAHYHAFHVYTLKEIAILGIWGNKIKWYGFLGRGGGGRSRAHGVWREICKQNLCCWFWGFFWFGGFVCVEVYGLGLCWGFFLFPWKSVPLIVSLKTSCTAVHLLIC